MWPWTCSCCQQIKEQLNRMENTLNSMVLDGEVVKAIANQLKQGTAPLAEILRKNKSSPSENPNTKGA